jgi:segregation and condensation protein A
MVPRRVGLDPGVVPRPPDVRIDAGPADLAALAARVIGRRREPDLDHLDLDLPSVGLAIEDIRERVAREVETDFDVLTSHLSRPVEVVAYFLAMLELARWGLLDASQEDVAAPIRIRHRRDGDGEELLSEWGR